MKATTGAIWEAASADDSRPVLNHVSFDAEKATLTATNSYIAAIVPCEVEDGDESGLIPAVALKEAKGRSLAIRDGKATLRLADGERVWNLNDGSFPDFSSILEAAVTVDDPIGVNPDLVLQVAKALGVGGRGFAPLVMHPTASNVGMRVASNRGDAIGVLMPVRIADKPPGPPPKADLTDVEVVLTGVRAANAAIARRRGKRHAVDAFHAAASRCNARTRDVTDCVIWGCDCVTGFSEHLDPGSVDLTVTSIPFGSLFMYSGKNEDIGNNQDGVDFVGSMFGLHLRFCAEQLLAVHREGTNVCIHIQQLVTYRIQHGYMGRRDFRGAVIDVFEAAGFEWKGEVAIPKNPQVIAQRQKLHSLLFITGRRDARDLAPAVNDFLLIFQKPGDAVPVKALRHEENPDGWVTGDEWVRWARGTWDDIRETDVLEGWQDAREEDDEKHVCPLQLEVIRRCVKLYSNPGELVLDPFMGIGSTAYVALEQGRRAVGFELKESYHRQAVKNAALALTRDPDGQLTLDDAEEAA